MENCEHEFIILDVVYSKVKNSYTTLYIRSTNFFCAKCTKTKEDVKMEEWNRNDPKPPWYKEN